MSDQKNNFIIDDLIYQFKLISNVLEAAQILTSIAFNTAIDTVIETTQQRIKYKKLATHKAQHPKTVNQFDCMPL